MTAHLSDWKSGTSLIKPPAWFGMIVAAAITLLAVVGLAGYLMNGG